MEISIPDSIIQSIRLPEKRLQSELLKELALALYSQDLLSFGKALELAQLSHYEFSKIVGERNIIRHYSQTELEEDLDYAGGK
jgi:predicted HTH domain antitoxin